METAIVISVMHFQILRKEKPTDSMKYTYLFHGAGYS
jgi:hypothetical protein